MKLFRCFIPAFAITAFAAVLSAQDTWSWISAPNQQIVRYAYGGNQFVGVGGDKILTSTDGSVWTIRDAGTTSVFNSIVFDGTRFLAVGDTSIARSTDGVTWSQQPAPARLEDLAYGNGVYVAIAAPAVSGGVRRFLTSTDRVAWTLLDHGTTVDPAKVRFAKNVFVAAGTQGQVLTSSNGVSWASVTVDATLTAATFPQLVAGNERLLLSFGSTVYTSIDGSTWHAIASGPTLHASGQLGFAGGYFYADEGTGGRGILRSADGDTWSVVSMTANSPLAVNTMGFGGGLFVASEKSHMIPGTAGIYAHPVHTSTDGLTWRSNALAAYDHYRQVVYGLGRFFFAGQSSHDGLSWADCGFEPTHAAGDRVFRVTGYDEYGRRDRIGPWSWIMTTVEVSSDGLTSQLVDAKMGIPFGFAFGSGRYVMVGYEGKISTSTDALTWTAATSGTTHTLYDVIYAFDRFIAAGDAGTLLTSVDGLTWTDQSSASLTNFNLIKLTADSTRLVVAASRVPYTTSTAIATTLSDGIPVAIFTGPAATESSDRLTNASFARLNGTSLVASYFKAWSYANITAAQKSTDGATWTDVPVHFDVHWNTDFPPSVAAGNNTAVLIALGGDDYSYAIKSGSARSLYYQMLRTTAPTPASAPAIIYQPVAVTVARGETASFSAGVTGDSPFSYQWYHDGTAIAAATESVLMLPLTTDAAAGEYSVKIANAIGTATSATVQLKINPPVPLAITEQPIGGELFDGRNLTLHVAVTGSGPIKYQWRRNGVAVSGGSAPTLLLYGYTFSLPSTVGDYDVVISAPYSTVTSHVATVARGGPTVTLSSSGTATVGSTIKLIATATGVGPLTYRWWKTGDSFDGATTGPTLILPCLALGDSGPYWVEVTDANGLRTQAVTVIGVSGMDTVNTFGVSAIEAGQDVTLRAGLFDSYGYHFVWRFNGTPLAGATKSTYTIHSFAAANEGKYDVVVTAPDGSTSTRSMVELSLDDSRLVNLSARGFAGSGEDTLIQGFVLSGAASTVSPNVLVRSIGPTLKQMGVSAPLNDPSIRVLTSDRAAIAENDNWSTAITLGHGLAATAADMTQFGAFPLASASRDAALLVHDTPTGAYTALVSGTGNETGIVLNEIYGPASGTQRLVNLSARARVSGGDNVLIAGFVIAGRAPMRLMIRAVGPTLSGLGIAHPLANPKLTLFDSAGREIHNNDNWGDAANVPEIRAAVVATGAFALAEASLDAAMVETLGPGVYTAHVTAADGTSTGVSLVEIYETP